MHQIRAAREAEIRRKFSHKFEGTKHQNLLESRRGQLFVRRQVNRRSSPGEAYISAVAVFAAALVCVSASDIGWAVFRTPALYDPGCLPLVVLGFGASVQTINIVRNTVGRHQTAAVPAATITVMLALLGGIRNIALFAFAILATAIVVQLKKSRDGKRRRRNAQSARSIAEHQAGRHDGVATRTRGLPRTGPSTIMTRTAW